MTFAEFRKWLVTPRGRVGRRALELAKGAAQADFGIDPVPPPPRSQVERTFDLAHARMLERELDADEVAIVEECVTPRPWWARVPWLWVFAGAWLGLVFRIAACAP